MIVAVITILVYIGIRESKIAGNLMVLLKIIILLVIISVGAFWVNPDNWSPFAPNGITGVMKGVAGVFFAYIGFDAVSTTAEECKNPKRDLPRSMILSLIITTVLYVVISLVLTGMVSYEHLGVGDPLAYAFQELGLSRFSGIIAISAIIAMAGVLLVFQVGQPRIWMSMSRDGLLPPRFSRLHPRFRTPAFATILTGIVVAVPSLFMNLTEVTDLTSIGTLFAFVLVSGGVLILDSGKENKMPGKFIIPYLNSRYFLPLAWGLTLVALWYYNVFDGLSWNPDRIPVYIFFLAAAVITFFATWKEWSLIPAMGLLSNLYLMSELGITNWMRFILWLAAGLIIYFFYSYRHSKLGR
jgi:amino acid transporter